MFIDGLDEYDNKILAVLEKNARQSYSEIGEQVGLSRVAVKNRMESLEERGIIQGYETRINATALPEGRRFFMDITTEPGAYEEVVDRIAREDIVRRVYAVTGDCCIRAEGFASSNKKYELFMKNVKRSLEGVRSIIVRDAQYTIKDMDGGVDYVSFAERKKGSGQME